jgi:ABC-type sugar transport system ATPase subunit
MISVENLCVRAGTFRLDGITFAVPAGGYGVLMGRTGSGKTTLLEVISGLKPAIAGSVRLLGREVSRLKAAERGVGYVPQDRALFPTMTVREHLAFALGLRGWKRADIAQRVTEIANLLGIGPLLNRLPQGLSGGEAQRTALGRALSFRPRVLLLDEPLSALDEETKDDLCALLKRIQRDTGVTTLHVTHSRSETQRLADVVFVLSGGRLETTTAAFAGAAGIAADAGSSL